MLRAIGSGLECLRPLWVGVGLLTFVWADGRYLPIGLSALIALWIWAGLASGIWWRRTPFALPWLIWLLMALVTLWATAVPELTQPALALFAAQGIAFWTMVTWTRSPARVHWAWAGLIAAGVALAALSVFWLEWGGRLFAIPAAIRTAGQNAGLPIQEAVNKNVMAGILVALWPLTLAWSATSWPKRRWGLRILGAAAAVVVLGVLVLSQSRGASIAAAMGLFVLLALRWRWLWLLALLAAAALALLIWQGQFASALVTAMQSDALGGLDGRIEVWSRALYAIQDFAFTGIGMGTFARVIPLLYPYFLVGPDAAIAHAHNLWLQAAVDLGLPGLIAFVSMVVLTAVLAGRSLRTLTQGGLPELAWLQRGALAGLSAALVHGLLDAVTWNTRAAFLVWALWGTTVAVGLLAAERTSPAAAPPHEQVFS